MFEAQTISKQLMDELLDYQFTAIEEREDREDMEADAQRAIRRAAFSVLGRDQDYGDLYSMDYEKVEKLERRLFLAALGALRALEATREVESYIDMMGRLESEIKAREKVEA